MSTVREAVRNGLLLEALGGPINLKISRFYAKHHGGPEKWMFSALLSLTEKGRQLARSLEEKDIDGYRRKSQ